MTHLRVVNWILLFVPLRGITWEFPLMSWFERFIYRPLAGCYVGVFAHELVFAFHLPSPRGVLQNAGAV